MRRLIPVVALVAIALAGAVGSAAEVPATPHKPRPHALPSAPAASTVAAQEARPTYKSSGRGRHAIHGLVNINQADEAALELLPGVGPVTAEKIVAQRKLHAFRRVDDITKVKGIGRKKLARMRAFLAVSGPTTIAEDDGATAPPRTAAAVEGEAPQGD